MRRILWICFVVVLGGAGLFTQATLAQGRGGDAAAGPLPSVATKTAGMQKFDGYFPFYWDARAGKIWLEIDKWDTEFLYTESLPAGLGSNDVGLDRGQGGGSHVVKFERTGPRVLMIEPNYRFRAISNDADERRTVEESFAQSALWGFDVAARRRHDCVGGRDELFSARFAQCDRHVAAHAAGAVPAGRDTLGVLFAAHEEFPEEHGSGSDADIHERRAGRVRAPGDARPDGGDGARASVID